jgi:hypothetical protein
MTTISFSRRWLRFSLRALLVAITLLCGWLGWEMNHVHERQRLLSEFRDQEAYSFTIHWHNPCVTGEPPRKPTIPIWRTWLGDRAVYAISAVVNRSDFSAGDFAKLKRHFPEAHVCEFEQVLTTVSVPDGATP